MWTPCKSVEVWLCESTQKLCTEIEIKQKGESGWKKSAISIRLLLINPSPPFSHLSTFALPTVPTSPVLVYSPKRYWSVLVSCPTLPQNSRTLCLTENTMLRLMRRVSPDLDISRGQTSQLFCFVPKNTRRGMQLGQKSSHREPYCVA